MTYIEQVLEATPQETATIWPTTTITKTTQVIRTKYAEHCLRSKDEVISNILLWTPTYGQEKVGRSTRTYI